MKMERTRYKNNNNHHQESLFYYSHVDKSIIKDLKILLYICNTSHVGVQLCLSPTLLHAAERQRVLPHKVVLRRLVVVFHHEAHHGQLRSVDGEAQSVVPHGVEPC